MHLTALKRLFLCSLLLLIAPASSWAQEFGDVLAMGDSLTAGIFRDSQNRIRCAAQGNRIVAVTDQASCRGNGVEGVGGWPPILKGLSGALVYNFGNSGERTNQMVARFPAHLAARSSQFVLILGGTNDMIFGGSITGALNNLSAMIQASIDAGRIPIIATIPPLTGSVFASANSRVLQLNDLIRQLPNQFDDLVVADVYNAVVANWGSLNTGDGIHFGSGANTIVANLWFEAMQASVANNSVASLVPIINLILDDD